MTPEFDNSLRTGSLYPLQRPKTWRLEDARDTSDGPNHRQEDQNSRHGSQVVAAIEFVESYKTLNDRECPSASGFVIPSTLSCQSGPRRSGNRAPQLLALGHAGHVVEIMVRAVFLHVGYFIVVIIIIIISAEIGIGGGNDFRIARVGFFRHHHR